MHRKDCPRPRFALACALLATAGLVSAAHAQRWQRPVGTDIAEGALDVQFTRDGGSISVGTRAKIGGDIQAFVVKHKPDGSVEWDREFGGDRDDIAYSVIQTFDGGYAVAFETENAPGGLHLGVYRFDPTGLPMWAFTYPGSFMTDPIHTPHPGPAIEEDPFTRDLLLTGNFNGLPELVRTSPAGALLFARVYVLGGDSQLAFTDLKIAPDQSVVISGTVRRFQDTGLLLQDAFLMRTMGGGLPIWANAYDMPPIDGRVSETGDGLDLRDTTAIGMIYLAGRTDFGAPTSGLLGTHYLATDVVAGAVLFDNTLSVATPLATASIESAYAAIRHDAARKQVVVAGRRSSPLSASALTAAWSFDDSGPLLIWAEQFARLCEGESVDADPNQCGVVVAGVIDSEPWPNGNGSFDVHHLKLNERGDSGCLQSPIQPAQQPAQFRREPLQVTVTQLFEQQLYPFNPVPVGSGDQPFCFSPWCFPCAVDINNDGLVNVNDFFAYLALYQAMNPAADLTMDGNINVNDFFLFLALYQAGCV